MLTVTLTGLFLLSLARWNKVELNHKQTNTKIILLYASELNHHIVLRRLKITSPKTVSEKGLGQKILLLEVKKESVSFDTRSALTKYVMPFSILSRQSM
jgi:hypothetical protein